MVIFFTIVSKRKEHSNDLRSLLIKHFQNGDSQLEITTKTLLSRETLPDIINKYKRTKRIGNLFGRAERERPQQQLTGRFSPY